MAAAVSTEKDASKPDQSSTADSKVSAAVAQVKTQEPFKVNSILTFFADSLGKLTAARQVSKARFFFIFLSLMLSIFLFAVRESFLDF